MRQAAARNRRMDYASASNDITPPALPPRRKKHTADGLVKTAKIDSLKSSSARYVNRSVPSPPAPFSPRNTTASLVKLKPPLRPELPKISIDVQSKTKSIPSNDMQHKSLPKISPQATPRISHSKSSGSIRKDDSSLTKNNKTTNSSVICRKYVYSPSIAARSTNLDRSHGKHTSSPDSRSIGNFPTINSVTVQKPHRPNFPFVQSTGPKEQSKSPKYNRVKPARPAFPPTLKNEQIYTEVMDLTEPDKRPPAKVPFVSVSTNSTEYAYVDPQKVLYTMANRGDGQKKESKTVNQCLKSDHGKASPSKKSNDVYSSDTSQYTSLQPKNVAEHEYALPFKSTIRHGSIGEESSEKISDGLSEQLAFSSNNNVTDAGLMNMSKEFGTPIDKSLTGSLSSSLSTLPMNHSEEQNTKREDDAEYITMSPRSLEKSDSGYMDVSGKFESNCFHLETSATSPENHSMLMGHKFDDCNLYFAISPDTMDTSSIYTVPS